MSNSNRTAGRNLLGAAVAVAFLLVAAIAGAGPAYAAGACALVPNARTPSEKLCTAAKPDGSRRARNPLSDVIQEGRPAPGGNPSRRRRAADRIPSSKSAREVSDPDSARHCRGSRDEMGDGGHACANLHAGARRRGGGDQPPPEPIRRPHRRGGRRYHSCRHVHGPEAVGGGEGAQRFFLVSASEWRPNGRDLPGF